MKVETAVSALSEWREKILPTATAHKKTETGPLLNRRQLRRLIHTHFDGEDLRGLCFDIGVAFDDLGGDGHDDRVRELILLCARDGGCERLIRRLRDLRPGVDWPKIV